MADKSPDHTPPETGPRHYHLKMNAKDEAVLNRDVAVINKQRQKNGLPPVALDVLMDGILGAWVASKAQQQRQQDLQDYQEAFARASEEDQAAVLAILTPYLMVGEADEAEPPNVAPPPEEQ